MIRGVWGVGRLAILMAWSFGLGLGLLNPESRRRGVGRRSEWLGEGAGETKRAFFCFGVTREAYHSFREDAFG
jgi:hypothetical protein